MQTMKYEETHLPRKESVAERLHVCEACKLQSESTQEKFHFDSSAGKGSCFKKATSNYIFRIFQITSSNRGESDRFEA